MVRTMVVSLEHKIYGVTAQPAPRTRRVALEPLVHLQRSRARSSLHNTAPLEIWGSAIDTASYRSKTRSLCVQKIRRVLTKKRFLLVTWVLIWNILLTKHLFTPRISLFWHFKRTFTSTCYRGHFPSGGCISQSERSSYHSDLSRVGWSHDCFVISRGAVLCRLG